MYSCVNLFLHLFIYLFLCRLRHVRRQCNYGNRGGGPTIGQLAHQATATIP